MNKFYEIWSVDRFGTCRGVIANGEGKKEFISNYKKYLLKNDDLYKGDVSKIKSVKDIEDTIKEINKIDNVYHYIVVPYDKRYDYVLSNHFGV